MGKPKIALYWCSSCGGCEESVIDLGSELLTMTEAGEIVLWPIAMDFKYEEIEALGDREIKATLINGAVRMEEQAHMAAVLRKKSELIVAHGTCAHLGGVVGLANFWHGGEILRRAYREIPTVNNPGDTIPMQETEDQGNPLVLSGFHDTVKTLDQVIEVDYYIPGCPPTPELIQNSLHMILENRLPPKGSVLAPKKTLCETCTRRETLPTRLRLKSFRRSYEIEWDADRCFLAQGIICLGPATRGGCGERCIRANAACRGCFGPTDEVRDHGAKILSFLAAILDSKDEHELEEISHSIPDPAGLFYRYSLAASLLKRKHDV